ncbi:MAG: helix-turn-helix domain-containing protein [Prevotellaceae bacterium]|jgi:excisionase family DNA binding protein|nr:helix-turn-helix domain-containing protein [Prevotellaceae bacterium]
MEKTMTVADVAKQLKVSASTVYKYTEKNIIPSVKIGNRTRIMEDQLNAYILSCKKEKSHKQENQNESKEK